LDSRGTPGPGREGACVSCRGWTGESSISPFATLTGAWAVNDPSATNVVQIVISGTKRRTPESAISMPAFGNAYSDAEIAAVANYVAARFSNKTRKLTQFLTHFHICKEIRLHVLACLMNEVTRFELEERKVIALGILLRANVRGTTSNILRSVTQAGADTPTRKMRSRSPRR